MKKLLFLFLLGLICSSCTQTEESFLESKEAYFGLTPPGIIPEVFAPNIVSDSTWAEHCQVAVSPKGDEIYWSAWSSKYPPADTSMKNSEQIYFSEFKNGAWSKPALADFVKDHLTLLNGGPSFTPDGNRIYFYSTNREGGYGKKDIWYVDRTENGWSNAINAGELLNTAGVDWAPSFNSKGYAYTNSRGITSKLRYKNEKLFIIDTFIIHQDFRPAWNIYVSPLEDYVIFAAMHKGGYGDIDLYISFKTKDNHWGYPINMGADINTKLRERFPMVSPDGKYLFFMRHTPGQDIFWVSTDLIKNLKTKFLSDS